MHAVSFCRFFAASLFLAVALLLPAQEKPLSQSDAREALEYVAELLNSQSGQSELADRIGDNVGMTASVDGTDFVYSCVYPGITVSSPDAGMQLAKFMMAVNRDDPAKVQSFMALAGLLERAGYHMRADYFAESKAAPVLSLRLSPQQMRSLFTDSYSDLGIDARVVFDELLSRFRNDMVAAVAGDDEFKRVEVDADGAYVRIICVMKNGILSELSNVDDGSLRDFIVSLIGAEKGARGQMELLSKACSILGMRGFKVDYRDDTGIQKVILLPWDKLLLGIENKSATPVIDLFVASLNNSLKSNAAADSPRTKARYVDSYVCVVVVCDAYPEDIEAFDVQEEKAGTLIRLADDDMKDVTLEMMKEGLKGYRYIYFDRDMTVSKTVEIPAAEILEFDPEGNSKFGVQ